MATARQALLETDYAGAWAEGRSVTLEQLIAEILGEQNQELHRAQTEDLAPLCNDESRAGDDNVAKHLRLVDVHLDIRQR